MKKDQAQSKIKEVLEKMSCTDVVFSIPKEDVIVAIFNCKDVTSFVTDIAGWTYSGVHLDPSGERQYRIDFTKMS